MKIELLKAILANQVYVRRKLDRIEDYLSTKKGYPAINQVADEEFLKDILRDASSLEVEIDGVVI